MPLLPGYSINTLALAGAVAASLALAMAAPNSQSSSLQREEVRGVRAGKMEAVLGAGGESGLQCALAQAKPCAT